LLLLVPSASTIVVAPPGQVAAESRRRRPVGLPASLCGLHFGSQHRITLRGRGQIVPGSHVGGHHYRPFNGEIVAAVALRPGGWSEEYRSGREEGVDEKVAVFFYFIYRAALLEFSCMSIEDGKRLFFYKWVHVS